MKILIFCQKRIKTKLLLKYTICEWLPSTLHLRMVFVSSSFLPELRSNKFLQILDISLRAGNIIIKPMIFLLWTSPVPMPRSGRRTNEVGGGGREGGQLTPHSLIPRKTSSCTNSSSCFPHNIDKSLALEQKILYRYRCVLILIHMLSKYDSRELESESRVVTNFSFPLF